MDDKLKKPLAEYLIAFADDQLILGHRASEWCGHAPILEEDIAFANISIDEIGHARVLYELAAELLGEDRTQFPDQQAFFRNAVGFRNVQMVSLMNGDWAFSMLRQFFYDVYETMRLEQLKNSSYAPVAEVSAKLLNEEHYHLRHTKTWVLRLGLGTNESNLRMQKALEVLWPFVHQLFIPLEGEPVLALAGIVPPPEIIREKYLTLVSIELQNTGLHPPDDVIPVRAGREQQTESLVNLLIEMQSTARSVPEGRW